ncbi:hypothetical protein L1887_55212 [Cichorium endivia]|nr:hypothetical protein L1887_55212 [Cichorium endivia]
MQTLEVRVVRNAEAKEQRAAEYEREQAKLGLNLKDPRKAIAGQVKGWAQRQIEGGVYTVAGERIRRLREAEPAGFGRRSSDKLLQSRLDSRAVRVVRAVRAVRAGVRDGETSEDHHHRGEGAPGGGRTVGSPSREGDARLG